MLFLFAICVLYSYLVDFCMQFLFATSMYILYTCSYVVAFCVLFFICYLCTTYLSDSLLQAFLIHPIDRAPLIPTLADFLTPPPAIASRAAAAGRCTHHEIERPLVFLHVLTH